jgi:hypothetical protein
MDVGVDFLELIEEKNGVHRVTVKDVAERANVSWHYANAVMKEYKETDYLADPFEIHDESIKAHVTTLHLNVEEEMMFMLALRAEDPKRSNIDYIKSKNSTSRTVGWCQALSSQGGFKIDLSFTATSKNRISSPSTNDGLQTSRATSSIV